MLATISDLLGPYVGATMARASVRGFCERLKIDGLKLDRQEVTRLIEALAPGLDVYLGKDKARTLVAEIWRALDAQDLKK